VEQDQESAAAGDKRSIPAIQAAIKAKQPDLDSLSLPTPHDEACFIYFFSATPAPLRCMQETPRTRHVFDVCNQFVINEPDRPISFGFTRTGTARAMIMATIILSIQRICERALHAHSPTADSTL
jgi:hypothetical protein